MNCITNLPTYRIVADLNCKNNAISRGSSQDIRLDPAATRNRGESGTKEGESILICRIDILVQRGITEDSLLKHYGRERILCPPLVRLLRDERLTKTENHSCCLHALSLFYTLFSFIRTIPNRHVLNFER